MLHGVSCKLEIWMVNTGVDLLYWRADKPLARPGRKQARKHVRDACDFNNIETRAVINFLFLQGKAPKDIHAILTETLACFLPGRAKDLSPPLCIKFVAKYLELCYGESWNVPLRERERERDGGKQRNPSILYNRGGSNRCTK